MPKADILNNIGWSRSNMGKQAERAIGIPSLFGDPTRPIAGYGTAGGDEICFGNLRGELPPGSKNPTSFDKLPIIRNRYNLPPGEIYPGHTISNFLFAVRKLLPDTVVRLNVALANNDPISDVIKTFAAREGIELRATGYEGQTARSIVVPVEIDEGRSMDRVIFPAKPLHVPSIIEFDSEAGILAFGPLPGQWEHTLNNGKEHIDAFNIPHAVIASESKIKQAKKDTYKKDALLRILKGSLLFCNATEASGIVELNGEIPAEDTIELVGQVQRLGEHPFVCMSFGAGGAMIIDEETNRHILYIEPKTGKVYTLGLGDQFAAGVFSGQRMGESYESSLTNAARAAANLGDVPDAQSGQMRASEWRPHATAPTIGARYEVVTPHQLKRRPTHLT